MFSFFKKKAPVDQLLLLNIKLDGDDLGTESEHDDWHSFQSTLEMILSDSNAGELDGDEWGGGYCVSYLYGPDVDKMYDLLESEVISAKLPQGSFVIKRYGKPGAREVRLDVGFSGIVN